MESYTKSMEELGYEIRLPEEARDLTIQEEFFLFIQNGKERKLRIHDYGEIYPVPYLFEHLMNKLQAKSHTVVPSLLIEQVTKSGNMAEDLAVLEIGAGSGMLGKALADLGVKSIVGIDILPEAAEAAKRQYPGVYEDYYAEDLTHLSKAAQEGLNSREFNCIVCGTALGFNHIPSSAWATAFNQIAANSWVAFNVQKERWEDKGSASFMKWHPWVAETDVFEIVHTQDFQHRFHVDGRSVNYVAIIGIKKGDILRS